MKIKTFTIFLLLCITFLQIGCETKIEEVNTLKTLKIKLDNKNLIKIYSFELVIDYGDAIVVGKSQNDLVVISAAKGTNRDDDKMWWKHSEDGQLYLRIMLNKSETVTSVQYKLNNAEYKGLDNKKLVNYIPPDRANIFGLVIDLKENGVTDIQEHTISIKYTNGDGEIVMIPEEGEAPKKFEITDFESIKIDVMDILPDRVIVKANGKYFVDESSVNRKNHMKIGLIYHDGFSANGKILEIPVNIEGNTNNILMESQKAYDVNGNIIEGPLFSVLF